jgi:hypothetical protein
VGEGPLGVGNAADEYGNVHARTLPARNRGANACRAKTDFAKLRRSAGLPL